MADEELVKKFLSSHHHFELFKDFQSRKKVRCKLTGHELPCRLSDLERYAKGKKYQRLIKDVPTHSPGYEEYKKFLKPSVKQRHQLYCELTNRYINDAPNHIQRHVTGKRFTRALEKYRDQQSCQESSTQAEEEMWVPSDLESDSGSEITDNEDMNETKESDESGGNISSSDDDDSTMIKDGLKRTFQGCDKNKKNKKAKTCAEGEFQKDKLNTWPKKPKAKRSKAS